jgi:hypothetical protein
MRVLALAAIPALAFPSGGCIHPSRQDETQGRETR